MSVTLDDLYKQQNEHREASAKEHANLLSVVTELKEDLRGNATRNIEGIIPGQVRQDSQIKTLEDTTRPLVWAKGHLHVVLILAILFVDGVLELTKHGLITSFIK